MRFVFGSTLVAVYFALVSQLLSQDLSKDLLWLLQNHEGKVASLDIDSQRFLSSDPEFQDWLDRASSYGDWMEGEVLYGSTVCDDEWRQAFGRLSPLERQQLLVLRFQSERPLIWYWRNVFSGRPPQDILQFPPAASIFESDVKGALLSFYDLLLQENAGVRWDGIKHDHVYSDATLEKLVRYLAAVSALRPEFLRDLLKESEQRISPDHWFLRDTQTTNPESRLEAIDLLSQELTEVVGTQVAALANISETDIDSIRLKALIKKAFRDSLLGNPATVGTEGAFQDKLGFNLFMSVLNGGQIEFKSNDFDSDVFSGLSAVRWPILTLFQIPSADELASHSIDGTTDRIYMTVGDKSYQLLPQSVVGDANAALAVPVEFDSSSVERTQTLNYLIAFALTESLSYQHKLLIAYFFRAQGYHLTSDELLIDAKDQLESDFISAHHLINISNGDVGDENLLLIARSSYRMVFQKSDVRLIFYTPPMGSEMMDGVSNARLVFSKSHVADLIQRRHQNLGDSLCIFPFVCDSSTSIRHWMETYRQSAYQNGELMTEQNWPKSPVIIASGREFDGESLASQFSHAIRIAQYISLTSSGASLAEVLERLDHDLPQIAGLKNKLEKISEWDRLQIGGLQSLTYALDPSSFEPVTNKEPQFEHFFRFDYGLGLKIIEESELEVLMQK
jgi:hypothetical protein